jgi:hypothetical protein
VTSAPTAVGVTLAEARALLCPFVQASIVEPRDDGRLELVDRLVAFAIGSEAPPA